jgi:acyl-CoA dehydrogenase
MARLLTLKAAYMMDTVPATRRQGRDRDDQGGGPQHGLQVIDWAMQAHGGGGMSDDFPLAYSYASQRTLRWPTVRTKCTGSPSPNWNWPNTCW